MLLTFGNIEVGSHMLPKETSASQKNIVCTPWAIALLEKGDKTSSTFRNKCQKLLNRGPVPS